MTPLEYVEVVAVENALYGARCTVGNFACRGQNKHTSDWKRYIWALEDELGFRGIDGVRLRHG